MQIVTDNDGDGDEEGGSGVACVAEPGSNPPDARHTPLTDTGKSNKQECGGGGGTSQDSDSQMSVGASTRKGLRQHLAEITDSVM